MRPAVMGGPSAAELSTAEWVSEMYRNSGEQCFGSVPPDIERPRAPTPSRNLTGGRKIGM